MKKTGFFILFLLILCSVSAFGQMGLKGDVSGGGVLSIGGIHLSAKTSLSYQPGLIGIGGGVKGFYGFTLNDLYLAPFIKVDLGSLYLGAGGLFMLTEEREGTATPIPEVGQIALPFVTLGLAAPLGGEGPGRLGMDVSIDFAPTAIESDAENLGEALGSAIVAALGSFKLSLGLLYSFKF